MVIEFPKTNSNLVWETDWAHEWAESYPLGDGKLGAMVRGNPCDEIIHLNHGLLWRDYLQTPEYNTYKDISEIRRLCFEKKWKEANELLLKTVPNENTIYINPYIPAFDLYISLFKDSSKVKEYRRYLNMESGIVGVEFEIDGVKYCRESFCSQEKGVFITHLISQPGMLTGEVSVSRMGDCECIDTGEAGFDYVKVDCVLEEGLKFSGCSKVLHRNGRLTSGKKTYGTDNDTVSEKKFGLGYVFDRDERLNKKKGASVCFDSCDEIWIITAIAVSAEDENPWARSLEICQETEKTFNYDEIKNAHKDRFSDYYNSMKLSLCEEGKIFEETPLLIKKNKESGDFAPELCNVFWNMIRYLAIAAGMPGKNDEKLSAPITLQGLWNRDLRPAWESDYHPDLNIEMCYWPMPALGLVENMEKYLLWMERLLPYARQRAYDLFGARGANFNGCNDYKMLGAVDRVAAPSMGTNAWFCQILWIYYEHKPSLELLKRIYKIMEEVSLYYEDVLIEDKNSKLTPVFGTSPEMGIEIDGNLQWLSSPSTYDLTLIREFYENYKTASGILGNVEVVSLCESILEKLLEPVIMDDGTVGEWVEDHKEADSGHRHRSPFVAFCPGGLYNKENSPEFSEALYKLLNKRQSFGTGSSTSFSYAWDAQILSRMYEGNKAYELFKIMNKIHTLKNLLLTSNDWEGIGGLTWFKGIKVFQIEAMLGCGSAISEMFYQDQGGIIRILPALPDELSSFGRLLGIKGRYGVHCDLEWNNKKITYMKLTSKYKKTLKLLLPDGVKCIRVVDGNKTIELESYDKIYSFEVETSKEYQIHVTY